jgi:response regulator RpfG family c-di-GMP phosphodiesterase
LKTIKIKVWLKISFAIAATESLIMCLFWLIPSIPPLIQTVIDVFLLTLVVVPLMYWFVFLPMNKTSQILHASNQQILGTQDQSLSLLIALTKVRDDETGRHLVRTRLFVRLLAERLKEMGHYQNELDDDFVKVLYKVAPLHDIGKVGIPDKILNKPGRLSKVERVFMMTHAALGATILNSAKESFDADHGWIATATEVAGAHHEKWDGTGYPNGLKTLDIPLAARIMSLADVYDALTSERPYKEAWTHDQAVQEVIRMKGFAFDPAIVDAFLLEESHFKQIADDFRGDSI